MGTRDVHPPGRDDATRDFDEFYAANFVSLSTQIYSQVGDRYEAQDIVQESFCRAWARWRHVSAYEDPVAWVRRVAWNLARSRWRRAKVRANFLRRQRAPEPVLLDAGSSELSQALATLPERQRAALVLHYLADLSVVEIARLEGAPEGTVKSWLHRGRMALAVRLAGERGDAHGRVNSQKRMDGRKRVDGPKRMDAGEVRHV